MEGFIAHGGVVLIAMATNEDYMAIMTADEMYAMLKDNPGKDEFTPEDCKEYIEMEEGGKTPIEHDRELGAA